MSNVAKRMSKGVLVSLLALLAALTICMTATVNSAYADDGGDTAIKVESTSASPGDTVQVVVSIENNPGILGAVLQVAYDEGLTLTNATSGDAFPR